ncbi:S4 domain-containing protein [Deinococcus sp. Marseille-Q6407]|uniref:S4 domain-containing protein n=1 Tax=Deinococcus sp. Marseille-Q6407 TaxID=2969223 RepID=UPI0021C046A8|nr:S4 domain-containing protein [Deinococcus sp. Marseille-Q6407]
MTMTNKELQGLVAKARGGRVVRTGFVDGGSLDRRLLDDPEIGYRLSGGFPDARQMVLTLYPAHIPEVDSGVQVIGLTQQGGIPWDEQDLRVQLGRLDLEEGSLGDIREVRGSFQVAADAKAAAALLALTSLGGQDVSVEEIGETSGKGSRVREVVVPSMRADVVGAKGFGVSRAYFQQGIDGGKVRLNGQPVRAGSEVHEGDSLSAEGLGRIDFRRVLNETRRGNYKVELEVHR